MKKLVVYGASNFGDEVAQLFMDINSAKVQWQILGYLDDNVELWNTKRLGLPVLGGMEWLTAASPEVEVVIGIGNPKIRRRIASKVCEIGRAFATGIHPTATVSSSAEIGVGTIVKAGCVVTTHVKLGNHVIVQVLTSINHNSSIGDFSTLNPQVSICGDVLVGEGVYFGTGVKVIDKVRIGTGAILGAGAVVVRDIPEWVTAVGVPAKVIKNQSL